MQRFALFLSLLFCAIIGTSTAQTIDPNFNPAVFTSGRVYQAGMQSTGKVIVTGMFSKFNGVDAPGIARLNTDGSIDNTFSVGTGPKGIWAGSLISHIAIQPDNKIIVLGNFSTFNGQARPAGVRLMPDGAVDETFNLSTYLSDEFNGLSGEIALLPDGSFITVKQVLESGEYHGELVKIKSDGSRDATFTATIAGQVYDLKVWNGKILVAGNFTACNGTAANNIVRLKADGSIDTMFGTGADRQVMQIVVQSTNKVILNGGFYNFNGTNHYGTIRLNTDDTVDPTFVAYLGDRVDAIVVDGADNVYASQGYFHKLTKMDVNGKDVSTITTDMASYLMFQPDGKLLALGYTGPNNQGALRLNTNFTKDNTYPTSLDGPRYPGRIVEMTTQPSGKIVMVGDFVSFGGEAHAGIVRLNADLSIDGTFATGTGFQVEYNSVGFNFVKSQSDGKLIISGQYDTYNGVEAEQILRLNSDGTLDNSYSGKTPFFFNHAEMVNDELYITDHFGPYITRRMTNGAIDPSFAPALDGSVEGCSVQADGKVLVWGDFTHINGTAVANLARLLPDGSLDLTFQADHGTPMRYVTDVLAYDESKIIVAGLFGSPADPDNQSNDLNYIGLDQAGVIRSDFQVQVRPTVTSYLQIYPLKDSSLLVIGVNGLSRLFPSGKFDNSFTTLAYGSRDGDLDVLSLSPTSLLYSVRNYDTGTRIFHVTYTAMPAAPKAPVLTSITAALSGAPTLTWQDNASDETQYVVERAGINGVFTVVGTAPANATTYRDGTAASNTTYIYRVAAANDYGETYSNTKDFKTDIVTGVEEALVGKLYPNPSRGLVQVDFPAAAPRTLRILNLSGHAVQELHTTGESATLDLSGQPAGMYCIQISEGASQRSVKVVKY
ncbi:MAG TPA: T9SS type A sorting domain-containing protein [Chryseolinea sp.]